MHSHPYKRGHELRNGQLWVDGKHVFLKTGKPLRNFGDPKQVRKLVEDLPRIAGKGYQNLALNCYWHHFNPSGDGQIEVSLEPLQELMEAIERQGMHASLSVETYGVGGGQIPQGFWTRHKDAVAVNHLGEPVRDTEYGYDSAVPSLFSKAYNEASRGYMTNLVKGLGAKNFLYFETTVEPQYMGAQWLDYSEMAKEAYTAWAQEHPKLDPLPFPERLPAGEIFIESRAWNIFRARNLAEWINGDALALKAGAGGAPLWIAVDYLDAEDNTMVKRLGDPIEMLRNLTEPNIVQVNWSWCNVARKPNNKAYERIHKVMKVYGKDWAISEHMTINGTDYHREDIGELLKNTLKNGTRFGWEFVDIAPDLDDPATQPNQILPGDFKPQHFSLYDGNWDPKPTMAVVENAWDKWLSLVNREEPNRV